MVIIDMQPMEDPKRQSKHTDRDTDMQTREITPEMMLQLVRELQLQNKELQREQAELKEALRTKEELLEKANALLAETCQTLPRQTTHDPLTGLLRHRAALSVLSKELARNKRRGEELAIGLCDIDAFKEVREEWGYQSGNEVLCWVAQTLTSSLREYDTVARIVGERFLLIMPLKPENDAESVCDRLCNLIANSKIKTTRGEIDVTVSIGVAYASAGSVIKGLWAEAEAALLQAKKQGGNRLVYFLKA